ncbi:flagellar biosynthesis anti-sigma factor FlgM [Shewanella inventionis]|uniref:Negative regulator of flagellin synthesis n=1 Tax=Shewanella inventionis TaxID=1738770 RepID=A0ABQ1IR03_9GAMM|nr:flagellar biosynthesis anti-sigma factor FlgM [Shewanella inventionis]MCL1156704.1 flagellar biosynthesis anti-sigma factor FlgM [Shewanella inventionis]GGB50277.1 flagellar biosynthesis anti-sigma factor FlgM [Shewanella inventionis]
MPIDIKNNTATNTQMRTARDTQSTSQSKTEAPQQSATPVKNDSVSITSQAQQLQGAQAKMAALPEVDQKKVAEIKQAISEGRYKVDPEKLAANIASFEAELSGLSFDKE